jgi:hypothetical protein
LLIVWPRDNIAQAAGFATILRALRAASCLTLDQGTANALRGSIYPGARLLTLLFRRLGIADGYDQLANLSEPLRADVAPPESAMTP